MVICWTVFEEMKNCSANHPGPFCGDSEEALNVEKQCTINAKFRASDAQLPPQNP
jgi:hypothetical protein